MTSSVWGQKTLSVREKNGGYGQRKEERRRAKSVETGENRMD